MEKLTDREVEVMMAIWDMGAETVTTGEILRNITHYRNPFQTLHMVLHRLCGKGFLECTNGRPANHYRPLVRKDDYLEFSTQNYIRYHFGSSPKRLVFSLLQETKLSKKDLAELKEMLQDEIWDKAKKNESDKKT